MKTTGIKVFWPEDEGGFDEIEFFNGIDVHNLRGIPEFTSVPAFWPNYEEGVSVKYVVRTQCEWVSTREVRLAVTYDKAKNQAISRKYPGFIFWGTNTIVLKQGTRSGTCEWRTAGEVKFSRVNWSAVDVVGSRGRRAKASEVLERDTQFRRMVLAFDGRCCALTQETTAVALEAAHLVPVWKGGTDEPSNGIVLRCDLHKLFDEGLFTFRKDGSVKLLKSASRLSPDYRSLLRGNELAEPTYERVKGTLALRQFRERCAK